MPAMSPSPWWPARSAMPSRSAPSSFSCRSSPCWRLSRCCPFRPPPSTTTGRETCDEDAGRGRSPRESAGYGILFKSRPLVIFGLCVMLFHFANAPLLPLVGQKLAAAHPKEATAMMSACIVAAQLVMLPIALLVGRTADTWGRKPLFLAGFAILPIRAVLYTLSDNSFWLIGVQLLDGVGAGIFGALAPLVIADIMRGTGRYNLAQGAIATVQGIGASLSGLAAGVIVDHFGYSAAFLAAGGAALVAVIVFALRMPETADLETPAPKTRV